MILEIGTQLFAGTSDDQETIDAAILYAEKNNLSNEDVRIGKLNGMIIVRTIREMEIKDGKFTVWRGLHG